jgi:hypothetical protein
MDPRAFDRLSRLLAAPGSRRGALAAMLAGVVPGAAWATNRRRHGHKPNGACRRKYTKCGGRCVDLKHDMKHCTACRNHCPTSLPNASVGCGPGTDDEGNLGYGCIYVCLPGWMDCDGDYRNGCETYIAEDADNCGGCGTTCGAGTICCQCGCMEEPIPYCDFCGSITTAKLIRRR